MTFINENIKRKNSFTMNDIVTYYNNHLAPAALATSFLAPLNRIKLLRQTMPLIAINEVEKPKNTINLVKSIFKL